MSDIVKASSDAIAKASVEASEAARQGETYAAVLAALQAAQQQQPAACTHPAPAMPSGASGMKWLAIGMGGSALLLTVAISAVAVAVSAVAVTVCLLILRSVLRDVRKAR